MKKRIFILMAVMGLSLALAACGASKAEEKKDDKKTESTVKPLVIDKDEKEEEQEDDGEVLDGTDEDNNMVDPATGENVPNSEAGEDWSDFYLETTLVSEDEVTEDCIEFNREYSEYFRLDFNHNAEIDKIEFYQLTDQDAVANGNYSTDTKYDAYFANDNNYDLTTDPVFIRYSVPEVVPDLVIRVSSFGGSVKEYLVSYNGRDGGAIATDITNETTFSH